MVTLSLDVKHSELVACHSPLPVPKLRKFKAIVLLPDKHSWYARGMVLFLLDGHVVSIFGDVLEQGLEGR